MLKKINNYYSELEKIKELDTDKIVKILNI